MAIPTIQINDLDGQTSPRLRMAEAEFDEFVKTCDENFWVEWVDGEVIMAPPASARHVLLVGFIYFLMKAYVARHELGACPSGRTRRWRKSQRSSTRASRSR